MSDKFVWFNDPKNGSDFPPSIKDLLNFLREPVVGRTAEQLTRERIWSADAISHMLSQPDRDAREIKGLKLAVASRERAIESLEQARDDLQAQLDTKEKLSPELSSLRNDLIIKLVNDGMKKADVACVFGISRSRVGQVVSADVARRLNKKQIP
jgi:predicted XRE-type DNA-binding protein